MDKFKDFFDANYYREQNPDLALAKSELWPHFESTGFREGRSYINISSVNLRNLVEELEASGRENAPHVRLVAAEICLAEGRPNSALAIVRDMDELSGCRSASIELRSLLALSKLEEAAGRVGFYLEQGLINTSWYSDHLALVTSLIRALVHRCRYKKAWELCKSFQDQLGNRNLIKELYYLSKCKNTSHYIAADADLSRAIAYQAEAQRSVDIAIFGYSRSVVLGHPEGDVLANHIDDLVVYKTRHLLNEGMVADAIDFVNFRLENRSVRLASGHQIGLVILEVAEAAILESQFTSAMQMVELSRDFDDFLAIKITSKLLGMILAAQEKKLTDTFSHHGFYGIAVSYINSIDALQQPDALIGMERHLSEFAYKCEVKGLLITAMDLYRLVEHISKGGHENLREKIAILGRLAIQGYMERNSEIAALDLAEELHLHGYIEQTSIHRLSTVLSFAEKKGFFFLVSRPERKIEPPFLKFYQQPQRLTAVRGSLTAPETYAAVIKNCIAFSRSNIIICENEALYDLAANPLGVSARLGDVNVGDTRILTLGANSENVLVENPSGDTITLSDGIAMFGVQSQNYGHWLLEYLPRMLEFDRIQDFPNAPIYVDRNLPSTIIESLRLLNSRGRPIKELPDSGPCKFDNLLVSSPSNFFPLDFRIGFPIIDTVWPNDVFSELKSRIISAIKQQIPDQFKIKKRIFISRGAFSSRSLRNSAEIERYLLDLGFEIIVPEKLTFCQQVEVFRSAAIVVGSCSSALSNAIFCDAGTPIVALIHDYPSFNFNGYASFIEAGGGKVTFVQGKGFPTKDIHPFHMDYVINLPDLAATISSVMHDKFSKMIPAVKLSDEVLASELIPLVDMNFLHSKTDFSFQCSNDFAKQYISGQISVYTNPNPFFDAEYYKQQIGYETEGVCTLLEHYVRCGVYEGLNPSILFDTRFYLRTGRDVCESGENPLAHFLRVGYVEGRLPFDTYSAERRNALNYLRDSNPYNPVLVAVSHFLNILEAKFFEIEEELQPHDFPSSTGLFLAGCIQLETEGSFAEALNGYQILSRFCPDLALVHYKIGTLLRRIGHLSLASSRLHRAFEIAPGISYISDAYQALSQHLLNAKIHTDLEIEKQDEEFRQNTIQISQVESAKFKKTHERVRRHSIISPKDSIPLLLFDTSFPDGVSSFRFGEFSFYLENMPESTIVSSIWDLFRFGAGTNFAESALNYCASSGVAMHRVKSFDRRLPVSSKFTYSVFLNNAAVVASDLFYKTKSYAFTLYPGGGFNINNKASDVLLKRVCQNDRFKGVITTQKLSYDYLVSKHYFDPSLILHKFGGLVPSCLNPSPLSRAVSSSDFVTPMKVCFVAQRYSQIGREKGYDVFVEVAARFKGRADIEFHVVGGFDETVIDLPGQTKIHFHGVQKPVFFPKFYQTMDVILSPAISSLEIDGHQGSFDGFPTTACVEAGVQGVAMFLVDSLNLNRNLDGTEVLKAGDEFELITRDAEQICSLLDRYLVDRPALAELGLRGREALLRLFSIEEQLVPRLTMLKRFAEAD